MIPKESKVFSWGGRSPPLPAPPASIRWLISVGKVGEINKTRTQLQFIHIMRGVRGRFSREVGDLRLARIFFPLALIGNLTFRHALMFSRSLSVLKILQAVGELGERTPCKSPYLNAFFGLKGGQKKDVLPPSRLLLAPKASPLRSSPPSHREGPELHRRGVPTLITVAPKCLILALHIAEVAVVFTSFQGHSTGRSISGIKRSWSEHMDRST